MSVSLCMIVRDAEATLWRCLGSVAGLFQEVIIVDTGSVDRTVEIARGVGANVCTYPWQDDFAAARNESLRLATGRWVFWLDADEELRPLERKKLAGILGSLPSERTVYVANQHSQLSPARGCYTRYLAPVQHPRLWRRLPEVRWQGRVHEQILPALAARGDRIVQTTLGIQHHGYVDPAACRAKLERNIRLSEIEVQEKPEDAAAWFLLGRSLLFASAPGRAAAALERSVELAGPADGWVGLAQQLLQQLSTGAPHVEA